MLAVIDWAATSKIALLTATMLLAAVVGIRVARWTHLPRVVGYLVIGVVVRLAMQWMAGDITAPVAIRGNISDALGLIKSLALCLILFEIGAAFDRSHLRALGGHIWKLSLAEISTVGVGVFSATYVVLLLQNSGQMPSPVQPLFLACAAIATAPAATLLVLRQYGAKGPLTDHILAMTGMNNLAAIVLFFASFLILAEIGAIRAEHMNHGLVVGIVLVTLGSALIGCVLGLVLSLIHIALTRFEVLLVFLALMLSISGAAKPLGINSLIICMFMGLTFINFSIQPDRFRVELSPITAPIFALFFVIAGFNLELHLLTHVGVIGIVFLIVRAAAKIVGSAWGVRWVGATHRVSREIGTGMLCQAGVAIALGKYLMEHWGRTLPDGTFEADPGAVAVNTVILASVVVFELTGPLAIKRAVFRAGEIKAITLLSRPTASMSDAKTVFTRLIHLLWPAKPAEGQQKSENLTVRHVMRTNIESLHDTASMTEVLKFVEHSRFNHFFVVDEEGKLVGTIDFADLRNMVYNPFLARFLKAYDMANTAPMVALADQPLREILDAFHKHDVGSMPVVESRETLRLLGVLEQRDVLRALHVDEDGEEESEH